VHREDLGTEKGELRDRETGIFLLENVPAGQLRQDYGLDKDVLVS
jgi:hypothetical protein